MVKVSKETARKNHADILNAASVSVREHGIGEASVAEIAQAAGLTHGALYRHFPTKNALVSAAISSSFEKIIDLLESLKNQGQGKTAYVQTYLGTDHRDHFIWGCPVAPLASEIHRLEPDVQMAFTDCLKLNIEALEKLIASDDAAQSRSEAIATLATLVGAMAMARATKSVDENLSNEILIAAKAHLSR